ncbi:MAG: hypothetical protein ACXQTR_04045 [Candidatus Methanospirareceae archaeon]
MIDTTHFNIASIQCSIFTPGFSFRQTAFLAYLLEHWGEKFDGSPTSIPLPENAPPEIPSIILTSNDNSLKMTVSRQRTDMSWNRTSSEVNPDVHAVVDEMSDILREIIKDQVVSVGRLAFILNRFAPVEDTAKVLAAHFCKEEWLTTALKQPENFELHVLKRHALATGQFNVNNWFRVRTGRIVTDSKSAILVQQDINTIAEEIESQHFELEQVQTFFHEAIELDDQVLAQYFP